jgi:hypothetical protein
VSNAVSNYRSLWVPKLDTLWSAKVKLADAAVAELEALLRLAGMKYAPHIGGCPTTEELDLWVTDLRNTLETERK